MQARVRTVAFQGIDVLPVDVQVMIAPGTIAFTVVGLADKAVGESRERIRAALRALGLSLPQMGTLTTTFTLGIAIAGLPCGALIAGDAMSTDAMAAKASRSLRVIGQ